MGRAFSILVRVGAGVVGITIVAIVLLYLVTGTRMMTRFDVVPEQVEIPTGEAAIERGRHVAHAISKCDDCHGEDMGGKIYSQGTGLGLVSASNLTAGKGGLDDDFTDADWVRTTRYGLRPNGTPLLYMPSNYSHDLTIDDLGVLIAYIRSLPPIDRVMPRARAGIFSRFYYLTGQLDLIPAEIIDDSPPRADPRKIGTNIESGRYLINVGGCRRCHGRYLRGGIVPFARPGTPLASNLTPNGDMEAWELEDFFNAMRKGREPDGGNLESTMPWRFTSELTDDEITAIWLYLQSL